MGLDTTYERGLEINNYLKFWSLCENCYFEDYNDWQEDKEKRTAARSHTAARLKNLDDCIREILFNKEIPQQPSYNFVDVGSGDGMVLFLASVYKKFKRIIGIELDEGKIDTSRENIFQFYKSRPSETIPDDIDGELENIFVINQDANRYLIKDDDNIFYIYNEEDMTAFITNLEESIKHFARDVWVIVYNPQRVQADRLDNSDTLELKAAGFNLEDKDKESLEVQLKYHPPGEFNIYTNSKIKNINMGE